MSDYLLYYNRSTVYKVIIMPSDRRRLEMYISYMLLKWNCDEMVEAIENYLVLA